MAAEFERLLTNAPSEPEWQLFFAAHPYVFSRALSLRLEPWEIHPLGRRGRDEPDFVFYERSRPLRTYGVIELKRPDQKILLLPRKRIITLTSDATTAIKQAQEYGRRLEKELMLSDELGTSLVLGNRAYLFVIMGLADSIAAQLRNDISDLQLRDLIPRDVRLIPYDTLLQRFNRTVPARVMILTPSREDDPLTLYVPLAHGSEFLAWHLAPNVAIGILIMSSQRAFYSRGSAFTTNPQFPAEVYSRQVTDDSGSISTLWRIVAYTIARENTVVLSGEDHTLNTAEISARYSRVYMKPRQLLGDVPPPSKEKAWLRRLGELLQGFVRVERGYKL